MAGELTGVRRAQQLGTSIAPFFFRSAGRRLFGAFHSAQGARIHETGVLICYPFGDEHIRSHRSLVSLSLLLAEAGYPVLRFDYFGTGDSEGELPDARWSMWLSNITDAVRVLRARAAVDRICVVGQRLGAILALANSTMPEEVCAYVLWDPVVDGREYMDELDRMHAEWLSASTAKILRSPAPLEAYGFLLNAALKSEIQAVHWRTLGAPRSRNVFLISNDEGTSLMSFIARMRDNGCIVDIHVAFGCQPWRKDNTVGKGVAVVRATRAIRAWLERSVP